MTTTTAVTTTTQCVYCGWDTTAHTAGEVARCNFEQRALVARFGEARCARG